MIRNKAVARGAHILAGLLLGCGSSSSDDSTGTDSGTDASSSAGTTGGPTSSGSDTSGPSGSDGATGSSSNSSGDTDSATGGSGSNTGTAGSTGGGTPICEGFPDLVTQSALLTHLTAFQKHADDNGGTRVSGLGGYDDSAQYVFDTLDALGYDVAFQEFTFNAFLENTPSELDAVTPAAIVYEKGVDFQVATRSGSGEVTTAVTAVDLDLGLGNNSTSGCQAGDFGGFPNGNIALIQRGDCTFVSKIDNAVAAGASAVVIFNQGDTEARKALFGGNLNPTATVPVLFASYDTGVDINDDIAGGYTLHVKVDADTAQRDTRNVIAESIGGDANEVIMLGAHLDSVPAGAGINDNATGSAALIELARLAAPCDPMRRFRFGWWGAEEWGLTGSEYYVDQLDANARAQIALYLNFDMIASRNHLLLVYDGDGSDDGPGGPSGSAAIEQLFIDYFAGIGWETRAAGLIGSSDYQPFIDVGTPVGGMSTGWSQTKSQADVAVFGGQAGEALDPCYHLKCDDIDNVDMVVMERVAKAAAHAMETYAFEP